jgi:hypothetical protein
MVPQHNGFLAGRSEELHNALKHPAAVGLTAMRSEVAEHQDARKMSHLTIFTILKIGMCALPTSR